jgi:hypothetical protein
MPPAVDLARRYGEALAALRAVHAFDDWLGDHWQERCPPVSTTPAARTALGASGEVSWHETGDNILGYLPDREGCFRIARDAVMPDFSFTTNIPPPQVERDVVISASMQDEHQSPPR